MTKKIRKILIYFIIVILAVIVIFSGKHVKYAYAANTTFENTLKTFPPSYRDALEKLHDAHSTWTFEAVNTGLDWNEVIANEMVVKRNLVPNTIMTLKGLDSQWYSTPTSWKDFSTNVESFNWAENQWHVFSEPYWVQASQEAVEYVMDPRNWLSEDNIFEFEQLSYNGTYQTYKLLAAMMENTFMDCDYATVGGTDRTYADVLIEAGAKYNISPVSICSRLFQEKGKGVLDTNTGRYVLLDTLATGLSTSDGGKTFHIPEPGETKYYNFFNIGASGQSMTEILNNGGKEAYEGNWTSQYLAILGGTKILASSKNNEGQDTLYFHKFSVVKSENLYWNQYMQNLLAPVNEGYATKTAYENVGMLDMAFHFKIPVYTNMPYPAAERPQPLYSTDNPNYKLSALEVMGTTIENVNVKESINPAFNMDITEYNLTVPFTTQYITINGVAIAMDTTTVSGNGTYKLNVGNNRFAIDTKSAYGTAGNYVLNVEREMDINLVTVSSLDFLMKGAGQVQIQWNKVEDATGYYVYRALPGGKYSFIGGTLNTSYLDKTAECGTTYFYKIVAFVKTSDGTILKGNASSGKSVKSKPETPVITETERKTSTSATVSWNAVSSADGYYIYRALPGEKYSFVGGTLSNKFTDKNIEAGKTYFYKVVAFKKVNGTIIKGNASVAGKILASVPQITNISASIGGKTQLSISKVTGATGYYVYRTTLGGTYQYIGKTSQTVFTDSGLLTGVAYYYKVIAYTYSDNVLYTTGYSPFKAIKAK